MMMAGFQSLLRDNGDMVALLRHLLRIDDPGRVTAPGRASLLLRRLGGGDPGVADELAPLLLDELERLADRVIPHAQPERALRKAALVSETWSRLVDEAGPRWDGRLHFFFIAARALRSVLVDGARRRSVRRRATAGGALDSEPTKVVFEERAVDLLVLEQALRELEEFDPGLVRVVELRFFAGLRHSEVAELTGCSLCSARRSWGTARAWLYSRLVDSES